MEMMPIFGAIGSIFSAFGGDDEPAPAPAPAPAPVAQQAAPEPVKQPEVAPIEKAPKVEPTAMTAAEKQRKAVVSRRAKEAKAGANTSNTRGGVSIVGG